MPSNYELSGRTRNHVNHLAGGISPDVEGELIHQLIAGVSIIFKIRVIYKA